MAIDIEDLDRIANAGIRNMKPCTVTGEELKQLVSIARAARALWDAHCKSHDAIQHPPRGFDGRKFAINYGELVALADALGIVPRETVKT